MRDVRPDLVDLTTLRLGGPAQRVVEATDDQQIMQMVRDGASPNGRILVLVF